MGTQVETGGDQRVIPVVMGWRFLHPGNVTTSTTALTTKMKRTAQLLAMDLTTTLGTDLTTTLGTGLTTTLGGTDLTTTLGTGLTTTLGTNLTTALGTDQALTVETGGDQRVIPVVMGWRFLHP